MNRSAGHVDEYRTALQQYLLTRSEDALYAASLLTESFIRDGLGPEDITLMHCESVQDLLENSDGRSDLDRLRGLGDAHQFLLELMIAYGVKYREYAERTMSDYLNQVEEQVSSERERAELLAMIAHEIATPLTVAHGGVSRASNMLVRGDVVRAGPVLSFARAALDRLRQLNDELREASVGDHEDVEMPLLPHDLRELADNACNWAEILADEKGVALRRVQADSPLPVICNSDSMQTVLTNVIANAIQYTPEGGEVSVSTVASERAAYVDVTDSGIGMTPDVQGRVFEKFFRGDEARRASSSGLGLGMALARRLMDAQGGTIEVVRSVPGEGTTIRVTLPTPVAQES